MDVEKRIIGTFIKEDIDTKIADIAYLYIIETKTGGFYTGVTKNFMKRWQQHENGTGAKYIKANGFKKPIFLKSFDNLGLAMKEERRVKKLSRKKKEELIAGENLLDSLYFLDV